MFMKTNRRCRASELLWELVEPGCTRKAVCAARSSVESLSERASEQCQAVSLVIRGFREQPPAPIAATLCWRVDKSSGRRIGMWRNSHMKRWSVSLGMLQRSASECQHDVQAQNVCLSPCASAVLRVD